MIGVDLGVGDILGGIGVFWLRRLILGSLAPAVVGLTAFILEPDLDPGL